MANPQSPPLRYTGSKWRLAPEILKLFPPHTCYCEPYCGGANILFRKTPSATEVINDLNHEVVNFFQVLRETPDNLMLALSLTPYSRSELDLSYKPCDDPLEKARRFYVRSWQGYGSPTRNRKAGWRSQTKLGNRQSVVEEWNDLGDLAHAAERLKAVMIECDDALKVINRFDSLQTLFYVDPPYVRSSRSETDAYATEMTDDEHRVLAGALHKIEGMVVLSGYSSPLYDELYPDWHCITFDARALNNTPKTECVWLNPACTRVDYLPLFKGVISRNGTES